MTLHVEAEHYPQVFARILHLVTAQVPVPVDISLEKGAKRLVIDVLLDPVHIVPSLWFLEQIEGLPRRQIGGIFRPSRPVAVSSAGGR